MAEYNNALLFDVFLNNELFKFVYESNDRKFITFQILKRTGSGWLWIWSSW